MAKINTNGDDFEVFSRFARLDAAAHIAMYAGNPGELKRKAAEWLATFGQFAHYCEVYRQLIAAYVNAAEVTA